ncbi:ECF transporter S component [Actinomyces radicidentis]|uniref:ABC transporter permease n=1 Tax=Actinomyces radicidentis TaxID=111015 RepID=A0A0X8JCM9_ACTRD|nr:ECF transporter S component [Actinomyces radicidentis]AMD86453.1 ABC transporter permease [Actinomyces radicidentis]
MTTPSQQAPTTPIVHQSSRSGLRDSVLGTRNLMTVAALAVVGSVIVVPLTYLTAVVATSPHGILVMCALMGAWMVPYLLPGVIINKPGAFAVAGLIMGIVLAFLTPQGPAAILGSLIGAAFVGVPVALTLYRHWTWPVFMASGIVFGGLNAALYATAYQVAMTPGETVLGIVLAVLSCWVAVGACLLMRRTLARSGLGVAR